MPELQSSDVYGNSLTGKQTINLAVCVGGPGRVGRVKSSDEKQHRPAVDLIESFCLHEIVLTIITTL